MFEPWAAGLGPSGFQHRPRPFAFRAAHLDALAFDPGDSFHFDIHLFDTATRYPSLLITTFAHLAHEGLGPERRRVDLIEVTALNERGKAGTTLYGHGSPTVIKDVAPLALNLDETNKRVERVQIRFRTPTELKGEGRVSSQPEFKIVASRARDRISNLRQIYGDGPLTIDFREYAKRASEIQMTRCEITEVYAQRRSSRTGQVHSIGGFVGQADYQGDLGPFLPYLEVAQWTGIGRQTVWGKGAIEVIAPNLADEEFQKTPVPGS